MWRGSSATVGRGCLVTVGQLACYDQCKDVLLTSGFSWVGDNVPTQLASSLMAAFFASVLSNPVDVAKTRLMNMKAGPDGKMPYSGPIDCLAKTAKSEGFLAWYKGFGPTYIRQAPFVVVTWLTVEQVKKVLKTM